MFNVKQLCKFNSLLAVIVCMVKMFNVKQSVKPTVINQLFNVKQFACNSHSQAQIKFNVDKNRHGGI